ncbi:NAD-dependent epimerase/dehydratase family protein [Mesorhizobium muleiense]|uniref:NAD dependent epimerase/dehydratase family protein n=1 Tax=Mesorhizobium muleiense TaxID=1004279 RepID=A0A1G8VCJ3_9HYPH|nr:NAD-dependent epimerase/dehydratase family protein [Mesorhizobium muleiense]SDJ63065.1 NAD dependent epimerase/dehydratase family protein [Mesorhizobium muleiense]
MRFPVDGWNSLFSRLAYNLPVRGGLSSVLNSGQLKLVVLPMRILLTGSSGWLGSALAPRLRALGHDVIGLDPVPSPQT